MAEPPHPDEGEVVIANKIRTFSVDIAALINHQLMVHRNVATLFPISTSELLSRLLARSRLSRSVRMSEKSERTVSPPPPRGFGATLFDPLFPRSWSLFQANMRKALRNL